MTFLPTIHEDALGRTGIFRASSSIVIEVMARNLIQKKLDAGERITQVWSERKEQKLQGHEVQLRTMSIRAQCFGPLLHARHRRTVHDLPPTGLEPLLENVEQLADHVTRFSITGIRALRDR